MYTCSSSTDVEHLRAAALDRLRFRLHALLRTNEPVEYWLWRLGRHGDVVIPASTSDFSFATTSLVITAYKRVNRPSRELFVY